MLKKSQLLFTHYSQKKKFQVLRGKLTKFMEVLFLLADNASEVAITAPGTGHHRSSSTGPTPDCSPPSPDTALKNIVKVIRPQVRKYLA